MAQKVHRDNSFGARQSPSPLTGNILSIYSLNHMAFPLDLTKVSILLDHNNIYVFLIVNRTSLFTLLVTFSVTH